ncbi:MAG: RNA polymerase factor sigma-54 [Candidatus Aminicenantes bacterium]|nr:RNA polymerase factor sigma-54 [Acidobacteriota bacterium]MCG2810218.1 RNA polymerase factor sigma-54 [Candidatus Aminicenantes bacterium]
MTIKMQLKGTQQLTITPVMHYFIQLLADNHLELLETLQNEVEANPMLEIETPEKIVRENETNEYQKRIERADASFMTPYEDHGFLRKNPDDIDKNKALEVLTPSNVSLADYLLEQAMATFSSQNEIEIARQIIYNLDGDGYLKIEIGSIASLIQTTPEEIERVRRLITQFAPPGCASKSLPECLLAQVGAGPEDEKLRLLIQDNLEDLSRSNYENIGRRLGISMDELLPLVSRLKRLTPRPAETFNSEEIEYAEVDLMLIKENGEYRVLYLEEGIPRLTLSQYYQEMLGKTKDKKTVSYLKSRYRDAQFFIESIELRKKTILRIAEYLVKAQKDYLDFGEKWKKPLTMKDVAHEVNLNESTISRAVSNKFMTSEKGMIPLKDFFSYGLKGDFGFSHAVGTIKDKIRELITAEVPEKPLADDEIAAKLAGLGIRIARRTVRNYREEMNIPSSFVRKKENKIKGVKK